MNFSELLSSRKALLRQAYLANMAFSYFTIRRLAERAGHARLAVRVLLRPTRVTDEIRPASLTALDGNQSVVEEHFCDEDVLQLADAIEFALESPFIEIEIKLDELALKYAAPLRAALDRAGVVVDKGETVEGRASRVEES
jgi:hypothetical protein